MLNDCGKKNQYQENYVYPDKHDFSSNLVLRSYSSADDHNKGQTPMENASVHCIFAKTQWHDTVPLVTYSRVPYVSTLRGSPVVR